MNKITIIDAIKIVLLESDRPMSVYDIYNSIIDSNLYIFKANNPIHIVNNQLRRHCKELNFMSASKNKHFSITKDGKYTLITEDNILIKNINENHIKEDFETKLKGIYEKYILNLQESILYAIQELDPFQFEYFCGKILTTYGFRNVIITRKSRDGGIDGYGQLRVGFTYFNVAFQCKRYTTKKLVGRRELSQFRGDIQGQYEQGIFFTTGEFSSDAKEIAFKSGAVPIVLLNGKTIVELMIEKQIAIETENLPVYTFLPDLLFTPD